MSTHRRPTALAALAFVTLALIAPASGAPPRYKEIEVENGAKITGRVVFKGKAPKVMLRVEKDKEICHATGNADKPSPRLEVSESGGVKYTVVFLKEIKEGKAQPKTEAHLDQKECVFEPHVVIVPYRESLAIRNSDSVLHNVHGFLGKSDAFNIGMPEKDKVVEQRMRRDGLISVKCDAGHSWMSAWVFVTGHPYYAVTDENGDFALEDIPAGKYELVVWHEDWTPEEGGKTREPFEIEVPVELEDGAELKLGFTIDSDRKIEKVAPEDLEKAVESE